MGVRPEFIPVLSSHMTNRKMQVRLEDTLSSSIKYLPIAGVGAQGTLLGVLQCRVHNNHNADCLEEDMRYKFVDNLSIRGGHKREKSYSKFGSDVFSYKTSC